MSPRVLHHGSCDSTQARALAALEAGQARHGDVHVAEAQEAGRGTRGRSWFSPATGGLYASVVQLLDGAPTAGGLWTAAGALALLDAAAPAGAEGLRLDWPNDLVDDRGAKLGGVLAETRAGVWGTAVVVGLGLNVGPMEFPAELLAERQVSCLAEAGARTTPEQLLPGLLRALELRLGQAADRSPGLSADFRAALALGLGPLRVQTPQGPLEGHLGPLDLAGDLCLTNGSQVTDRVRVEHVQALEVSGPEGERRGGG